jgi:hypothetical protein
MEVYRSKLKRRILLLSVLVLFSSALGVYDVFFQTDISKDGIFCFQCGLTTAIAIIAAIQIMRFKGVLSNDEKLKVQFNKENDERLRAIKAKAGMPMLMVTSIMIIVAAIIAGYFNTVIFITLVSVALFQLIFGLLVKLLYMKKM